MCGFPAWRFAPQTTPPNTRRHLHEPKRDRRSRIVQCVKSVKPVAVWSFMAERAIGRVPALSDDEVQMSERRHVFDQLTEADALDKGMRRGNP